MSQKAVIAKFGSTPPSLAMADLNFEIFKEMSLIQCRTHLSEYIEHQKTASIQKSYDTHWFCVIAFKIHIRKGLEYCLKDRDVHFRS